MNWIKNIHLNYSDVTELIEIGKSLNNRSLLVLKIGYKEKSDHEKKLFWFDSGIHAREWTTISTSIYTIDKVTIIILNRFENYKSFANKSNKNFSY
jgi:hypothetical protein